MKDLFLLETTGLVLTFIVFFLAVKLYQRFRIFVFNPVLLSIFGIIAVLKTSDINYQDYYQSAKMISFFLAPAVVALGVPLYEQMENLRKNTVSILLSISLGSVSGILSVGLISKWLGASDQVIMSLIPKSVTTPIAMGIAEKLGGIPSLSAALVITTGVLGAVLGHSFLTLLKIKNPIAYGLGMGAASHGIGTARAIEEGQTQGAFGGLAICLNGILTAILSPIFAALLV